MKTIWKVKQHLQERINELVNTYNISTLAATVLSTRSIPFGLARYFAPKQRDVGDINNIPGMVDAVARLWKAYDNKETVMISGDYDLT